MEEGYKVLSLFDGMGCAHLAMQGAGLPVGRYVAFEIDRFCNEAVAHNFPDAEQRGDVFDADFTEFEGFDFLMGGSPCTYWSVAQSADRRETTASGQGWELFRQYVRALREAGPRWFIYENNKSMSRAIRDSISEAFGFEPVHIDSALVSAQKRDRLYWVGRREEDGTYSQVRVEQPEDRGILLRDVLETGVTWQDKSYACTTRVAGATVKDTLERHRHTMVTEPVGITEDGKSFVLPATYCKGSSPEQTLTKRRRTLVAEPVNVDGYEFVSGESTDRSEVQFLGGFSREGERRLEDGHVYSRNFAQGKRLHGCDAKSVTVTAQGAGLAGNAGLYAVPTEPVRVGSTPRPNGELGTSQNNRIYSIDGKSVTMRAHSSGGCNGSNMGMYAVPNGFHEYMGTVDSPTYEVKDGEIEIRGRKYPIRLYDGKYIIRKLTVRECMRLQTVPEWYDFSCVSKTQAYRMLGNGWTVEVIVHLLRSIVEGEDDARSGD